jgi:hypothetical protein
MYDGNCETIYPYNERHPTAKKAHRCGECKRTIAPGEKYEVICGSLDGVWETYKTCRHCCAVREWLKEVCDGWLFECVGEDLYEHFREGYGFWLGRASVGVRRKWRRRDGALMPPLALPAQLPVQ